MVVNYIIDSSLFSSFQKGKALICGLNGSRDIKFSPTLTEPNLTEKVWRPNTPALIIVLGLWDAESDFFKKSPHPTSLYIYINKKELLGLWGPYSFFKIKCLGVRD